jgi:hypothetical protein
MEPGLAKGPPVARGGDSLIEHHHYAGRDRAPKDCEVNPQEARNRHVRVRIVTHLGEEGPHVGSNQYDGDGTEGNEDWEEHESVEEPGTESPAGISQCARPKGGPTVLGTLPWRSPDRIAVARRGRRREKMLRPGCAVEIALSPSACRVGIPAGWGRSIGHVFWSLPNIANKASGKGRVSRIAKRLRIRRVMSHPLNGVEINADPTTKQLTIKTNSPIRLIMLSPFPPRR